MTQPVLQNLLNQPYQSEQFKKQVIAEIFRSRVKEFELLSDDTLEYQNLTSGEKEIASSVYRYGSMTTADDKRIDLYEIVLQENRIIERNKVAVGALVKNRIIGNNAVFASFVYPDGNKEAWRFSFIARDSVLEEGEIKQVETNPKRYTYILGPGESCRTAAERFQLLADSEQINLKDIQEAFSVEKISKQFFKEYKEHYSKFVDYLNSSKYKITAFNNDDKAIRDFCKKLLGRIVFLYFLQKKGWLGVPVEGKWGEGDRAFLKNLFLGTGANQSFYAAVLTTLFFDTLNTIRENDICELIDGKPCRIPYLNGGLFEKESDKYAFLTFPPQLFTDLFEFFDSYNFTIYEDSPEEHTMAVDPEMLGHIFENLLEDNKDKGAYYTPKEIVHYMTQESLIEYLFTRLNTEHVELAPNRKTRDLFVKSEQIGIAIDQQKDNISREDIEKFIKQKETTDFIVQNAPKINRLLDDVKICDPAIGSGAFPMGLLHEIYSAKQVLHPCIPNAPQWEAAKVKENIIQNSIYGVDIEKGAVDIARLRFWLSLIVDEETPRPLPNLDYKVVVGNSLVPKFEDEVIEIDWDLKYSVGKANEYVQKIKALLKQIVSKQKDYFKPGGDKQKQKQEIRDLKIELLITQLMLNRYRYADKNKLYNGFSPTAKDRQKDLEIKMTLAGFDTNIAKLKTLRGNDKPFDHFDWKLDFPDVMNENVAREVGFDIVIANPPYVDIKQLKEDVVDLIFEKFKTAENRINLYSIFIEKSVTLISSMGILTFINPNSLLMNSSYQKIRKLLINNIKYIIKLPDHIFENAIVETMIFILSGNYVDENIFGAFYRNSEKIYFESLNFKQFKRKTWFTSHKTKFNIFIDEKIEHLLKKIEKGEKHLIDYFDFSLGITPYDKYKGHSEELIKNRRFHSKEKLTEKHVPLISGSNIKRYNITTEIKEYLKYGSHLGAPRKEKFFTNPRVIVRQIISGDDMQIFAGYTDKELYHTQIGFSILPKKDSQISIKYLVALMNSKVINFYHKYRFLDIEKNTFQKILIENCKIFPLKIPDINTESKILEKVDSILNDDLNSCAMLKIQQELDMIFYKLYQLTYDEALVVDPAFPLSKEAYENFKIESEV